MKKNILYFFFSLPFFAYSMDSDAGVDTLDTSVMLHEIGVTGHHAVEARKSLSSTPVFDRKTNADAPLQTVESALKLSPAVDARERGAKGVQTDLMVRGGSFDQTMVTLNGINFTDARTGHQSHSLPIDIASVSSISVVDGVCGVGAYAGAVDIRTSPLYPRYFSAEVMGGMHGYVYTALSGNYAIDRLSVMGAASMRHSDGYVHNTGFTNYNVYARAAYQAPAAGLFEAQAGYQDRSFGANGFYSRSFPDQYEHTTTALGSLRWQWRMDALTLSANMSYRYNTDRFELIKGDESRVPFNHHITDNAGAEVAGAYEWIAGETVLSVDMMYNHIWSTVLGDECEPHHIRGIDYDHKKDRTTIDALLRHTARIKSFTISAGGGLSHSPYGSDGLWSAGLSYDLAPGWRLGAGAVESMRLPTFTDLYYTAAGYESDRNLVPEHATTYHISANFGRGIFSAGIYGYYRHGRNVIDWVKNPDRDTWRSMQVTRINTYGVEFSASCAPARFVRRISATYGYLTQDAEAGAGVISAYAFDHLRHKFVAALDLAPAANLSVSFVGTLSDRVGNYSGRDGQIHAYDPYFLLDARVSYLWRVCRFYVDATNITATKYYDFGGLEMPRCWASAGVIVTIK